MENSSFDVEAIEIPTPTSITFENRCHNCKRAFTSIDYSYNYCPYCGEKRFMIQNLPLQSQKKQQEKWRIRMSKIVGGYEF